MLITPAAEDVEETSPIEHNTENFGNNVKLLQDKQKVDKENDSTAHTKDFFS